MKAEQRAIPTAPTLPVASHEPPRAKKLAALLRLGVPGALAGFACLAGAQPADPGAVALNPVVVTGAGAVAIRNQE